MLKEENVVLGKSELELQEIIVVPYYIFVGKNCLHFYNAIVKFILVFFWCADKIYVLICSK